MTKTKNRIKKLSSLIKSSYLDTSKDLGSEVSEINETSFVPLDEFFKNVKMEVIKEMDDIYKKINS